MIKTKELCCYGRWAAELMNPSSLQHSLWLVLGCYSCSDLALADLHAQRMQSADYLNILNIQVIPSMDFFYFLLLSMGTFQDDNLGPEPH